MLVTSADRLLSRRRPGTRRLRYARRRSDKRMAFSPARRLDGGGEEVALIDAYLAHFASQAARRRAVCLALGEDTFVGQLGFPRPADSLLPFSPDEGVQGLVRCRGRSAWLISQIDEAELRFSVRVRTVDAGGTVGLSLPQGKPSHSVRLTQRHVVDGQWRFEVSRGARWLGRDRLGVYDISCGGLGLSLPSDVSLSAAQGRTVTGTLRSPDNQSLKVQLLVRHLRRQKDPDEPVLGGCVFRQLGADNYAALAQQMYAGGALSSAAAA